MSESYTQVQPNSTGDKVRDLAVTTSQGSVKQQVVTIANERGDLMPTTEMLTTFGTQRVSSPVTLHDSKLIYDKQPLFWAEALTGGAASTWGGGSSIPLVTLAVTNGTDSATRQTKQWFNYQPGKSQFIMMTGVFSQQANVTKRAGYFNGTNGIYLKTTGSAVTWEILNAGAVTESVAQASWNLDTMDGTGPSGVTINFGRAQILVIDFQWLGVGRVRVGFNIGGRLIYVHAFDHANVSGVTTPYMGTPNLPVRYDITSSGGAGTLVQICSTVISEGGSDSRGFSFSVDTEVTPLTLPTSGVVALIAVRLAAARLGATIKPLSLEFQTQTAGSAHWHLLLNPSISGAALTYGAAGSSSLESALGATTNLCTGGEHLDAGFLSNTARVSANILSNELTIGSDIAGTPDVLVVGVENIATRPDVLAIISFRESL